MRLRLSGLLPWGFGMRLRGSGMRLISAALGAAGLCLLTACAPQTDADRSASEVGGTVPWNRPEKWEGPGVMGSQMQSMQGGGY